MSRQYDSERDVLISIEGLSSFAEKIKEQIPNISTKADKSELDDLEARVLVLEDLLKGLADTLENLAGNPGTKETAVISNVQTNNPHEAQSPDKYGNKWSFATMSSTFDADITFDVEPATAVLELHNDSGTLTEVSGFNTSKERTIHANAPSGGAGGTMGHITCGEETVAVFTTFETS